MSVFFSQAQACDDHTGSSMEAEHARQVKSTTASLEDTFGLLKDRLGVLVTKKFKDGVPAITIEDIGVLESTLKCTFPEEIKDFFITCGNLKWQGYSFPYVKDPASPMWTFFKEQDCTHKYLVPFCEINDSNGYYCFESRTREVVSFFPNPHQSRCHQTSQKWSSLQHFLIDYLKMLECSQDL